MTPDLTIIINGTTDTLSRTPNIGEVFTQRNMPSTWSTTRETGKSIWVVRHASSRVSLPGVTNVRQKTASSRVRSIIVEGWSPQSYSGGTARIWRDLLDGVILQLSSNLTLGVSAKMVRLPELDFNRLDLYSSPNQGDTGVLCHHCQISFDVLAHYPTLMQ